MRVKEAFKRTGKHVLVSETYRHEIQVRSCPIRQVGRGSLCSKGGVFM